MILEGSRQQWFCDAFNSKISRKGCLVPLMALCLFALCADTLLRPNVGTTLCKGTSTGVASNWSRPVQGQVQVPGSGSDSKIKVLCVFIAIGTKPERHEIIHNNINNIVIRNQNSSKYQIDCLIFGYGSDKDRPEWITDPKSSVRAHCQFYKFYSQRYVLFMNLVTPFFMEQSGYKYIHYNLDDVVTYPPIGSLNFTWYLDIIVQNNLGYIQPAVHGSPWGGMGPKPVNTSRNEVGRYVKFIEIQSPTFDLEVWKCVHELLDTEYPSGWGVDLWYYDYCVRGKGIDERKMAIVDVNSITHNPFRFPSSHVGGGEMDIQVPAWKSVYGVDLIQQKPKDIDKLYYFPTQEAKYD